MCFLFSFFAWVAFFAPLSRRCAFRSTLPGLDFFEPGAEALLSATSMLASPPALCDAESRISRGALTMVFFFGPRLAVAFLFDSRPTRLAVRRGVSLPIVVEDGQCGLGATGRRANNGNSGGGPLVSLPPPPFLAAASSVWSDQVIR